MVLEVRRVVGLIYGGPTGVGTDSECRSLDPGDPRRPDIPGGRGVDSTLDGGHPRVRWCLLTPTTPVLRIRPFSTPGPRHRWGRSGPSGLPCVLLDERTPPPQGAPPLSYRTDRRGPRVSSQAGSGHPSRLVAEDGVGGTCVRTRDREVPVRTAEVRSLVL